jgi:hypothetical protein
MSEKETVSTESVVVPVKATSYIFTNAYYVTEELTGNIALLRS